MEIGPLDQNFQDQVAGDRSHAQNHVDYQLLWKETINLYCYDDLLISHHSNINLNDV